MDLTKIPELFFMAKTLHTSETQIWSRGVSIEILSQNNLTYDRSDSFSRYSKPIFPRLMDVFKVLFWKY